ncbi:MULTISPECIES: hypothetical protein [unclassified Pseudomonas]|uniref:hypothetical protein n=1 Tax=unclassified Pseudomonas TaxID=196821 RepID=UPI002B236D71|nr:MULTISPECIES: hypothetical protein [unclassified Pseudomonas]MEA9979321.1 hypothetical protein [Pseudomonas sp. RTS4]MEB0197910.1 hypothetical protein [Pseudomonas sp. 5S4]MEB0246404.1 hypothetical protein [Pseudomonas sp. 10S5]
MTTTAMALIRIAQKPGLTPSTNLITIRRICRIFAGHIDVIQCERRALRRQAGKLRHYLPFTANSIYELQQRAEDHRRKEWDDLRTVMTAFGRSLMLDTEGLSHALGFDRVCDILSVNPAHRHQAHLDGDTSIRGVAFLSQLEDSADRQSEVWGDGGPLHRACQLAMMRFIKEMPSHLLPDPFAPGAVLGPKLPPTLSIVGN